MTQHTKQPKALRLKAEDIAAAARQGVERALAARQAAFTELTPEQIEQVSGGLAATTLPVTLPPIHGVVIKPPIHGVVIKPPVFGVVISPSEDI